MLCIRKCILADIRHIFMGLLEGNLVEKRRLSVTGLLEMKNERMCMGLKMKLLADLNIVFVSKKISVSESQL